MKFLIGKHLCSVGFAKVNERECQQCLLVAYNPRIMTSSQPLLKLNL